MKAVHERTGELLCPHSAVAAAAAMKGAERWAPDGPVVVLATAHPAKFPETVEAATGVAAPLPAHCATLFERAEKADSCANDVDAVKRYLRERTRAWR
jgi:threonine synthase